MKILLQDITIPIFIKNKNSFLVNIDIKRYFLIWFSLEWGSMKAIFWHEWRSVWLIVFRWAISISEASIVPGISKRKMLVDNMLFRFIYSKGHEETFIIGRFLVYKLFSCLIARKHLPLKVITMNTLH